MPKNLPVTVTTQTRHDPLAAIDRKWINAHMEGIQL